MRIWHETNESLRIAFDSVRSNKLRSALATQQLQRMGLEPVAHIAGGFGAWRDAGGPVEKDEA